MSNDYFIVLDKLQNTFWGTFKVYKRLGDFIMKIAERFDLLFDQRANK